MNSNDIKIDWKKYVDQIYCLTFAKKDKTELYNELKRVDIYDSGIYHEFENIQTPLYEILYNNLIDKKYIEYLSQLNLFVFDNLKKYTFRYDVTIGEYYCMKNASNHGYNRILILEDDVIFLKNKEDIINILENMLKCYNENDEGLLFLGGIPHICYDYTKDYKNIRNTLYQCVKEVNYNYIKAVDLYRIPGSSSCNFYDKSAYEHFINYIESGKYGMVDIYFLIYGNSNIQIFYSDTNIAVQENWAGHMINATYNHNYDINKRNIYLNNIFSILLSPEIIPQDYWSSKLVFDEINEVFFNNELTDDFYYKKFNEVINKKNNNIK